LEPPTDAQIIATAITVLAVLAGSVFNNVSIGDLNTSANRHLDDMREVLRAETDSRFEFIDSRFQRVDSEMNIRFDHMDSKLDTIIAMIGQLDTRLTKLGGRSR
jgi:hypothetical protein